MSEPFWSRVRAGTVLIVGLSERTGLAAARLFDARGVRYKVSDSAPWAELEPRLADLKVSPGDVFAGPQGPEQLDGVDQLLLSPGVPRSIPLVREAVRRGLPVQVDIDFAYELMADKRIVAITGTDGKTTTTSLTGAMLESLGPVVVAGNIGVSPLAKVDEIAAANWVVLEVSSFMLEHLTEFRPHIAALLNVAQDHVDRHPTPAEYAAVKINIVQHCRSGDVLVTNLDDPIVAGFRPGHMTIRTVSARRSDADSFFQDGAFHLAGNHWRYADCALEGRGNIHNILVAATIAHEAGVEPERIAEVACAFRPLPHRLQHLGRFREIDVYEDSKASNVHAVGTALSNFARNVVLIVGGRDKGLDFTPLRAHAPRIRRLVCYGESGPAIGKVLGFEHTLYEYRFEDAVRLAVEQCRAGDVLLLSPGCTSWDQFANYEVRGDAFQELIGQIFS